jgi:polyisoprenoid-binding protein YceI
MKKTLLILLSLLSCRILQAQIYTAKSTTVTFFSEAPLENIEAMNKGAIVVLNSATGNIEVRVTIQNFKFKNSLMEEHFNENYMETEKKTEINGTASYPNRYAEFKGKINEPVDYGKEGETNVTVTGKLAIHGVSRDVTLNGLLNKKGEELAISSKFRVKVTDYNIKVPSMYVKNIAEEVDVNLSSILEPYKKKK